MTLRLKNIIAFLGAGMCLAVLDNMSTFAQSAPTETGDMPYEIVISPLFEYPSAPEELVNLQDRSDWLVEHFWDKMNFKDKATVDQNALNDAFYTYIIPMRYASLEKAEKSIKELIGNISKNPALSIQFAKAAEETLYGPRAEMTSDDVLLPFISNVLKVKKLKPSQKEHYETLYKLVSNTRQGTKPPEFDYQTPEGKIAHYRPNGVITVLEFGDSKDSDSRFAKLRMSTDVKFSSMVDRGKINVLYIETNPNVDLIKTETFPVNWYVGNSKEVAQLYDIRLKPSIYVIDREGKVAVKNVNVETAMQIAVAAAEQ